MSKDYLMFLLMYYLQYHLLISNWLYQSEWMLLNDNKAVPRAQPTFERIFVSEPLPNKKVLVWLLVLLTPKISAEVPLDTLSCPYTQESVCEPEDEL